MSTTTQQPALIPAALYADILKPLVQVFKTANIDVKCDILQCVTGIVHRYASFNFVQPDLDD